jgi:hypothetical protein
VYNLSGITSGLVKPRQTSLLRLYHSRSTDTHHAKTQGQDRSPPGPERERVGRRFQPCSRGLVVRNSNGLSRAVVGCCQTRSATKTFSCGAKGVARTCIRKCPRVATGRLQQGYHCISDSTVRNLNPQLMHPPSRCLPPQFAKGQLCLPWRRLLPSPSF